MNCSLRHVAINADDVAAAERFYAAVFGWRFEPWGPPGFLRRSDPATGLVCALQARRELLPGVRTTGLEGTVGVADVAAVMAAAEASGGRVLTPPATIPGVGELVFLADPSTNVVGAMRYDDAPGSTG